MKEFKSRIDENIEFSDHELTIGLMKAGIGQDKLLDAAQNVKYFTEQGFKDYRYEGDDINKILEISLESKKKATVMGPQTLAIDEQALNGFGDMFSTIDTNLPIVIPMNFTALGEDRGNEAAFARDAIGTHWILLVAEMKNGKFNFTYVDPTGSDIGNDFKKWINNNYPGSTIKVERVNIQGFNNNHCGPLVCKFAENIVDNQPIANGANDIMNIRKTHEQLLDSDQAKVSVQGKKITVREQKWEDYSKFVVSSGLAKNNKIEYKKTTQMQPVEQKNPKASTSVNSKTTSSVGSSSNAKYDYNQSSSVAPTDATYIQHSKAEKFISSIESKVDINKFWSSFNKNRESGLEPFEIIEKAYANASNESKMEMDSVFKKMLTGNARYNILNFMHNKQIKVPTNDIEASTSATHQTSSSELDKKTKDRGDLLIKQMVDAANGDVNKFTVISNDIVNSLSPTNTATTNQPQNMTKEQKDVLSYLVQSFKNIYTSLVDSLKVTFVNYFKEQIAEKKKEFTKNENIEKEEEFVTPVSSPTTSPRGEGGGYLKRLTSIFSSATNTAPNYKDSELSNESKKNIAEYLKSIKETCTENNIDYISYVKSHILGEKVNNFQLGDEQEQLVALFTIENMTLPLEKGSAAMKYVESQISQGHGKV